MGVRFLPSRAPFLGVASEVDRWASAVVANGGTVSAGRVALMKTFVAAEMASGAWERTDDYIFQVGENTAQALTSLKQRRLGTLIDAPAFTIDRGYAYDGSNDGVNTGFVPASHAVAMRPTDVRIAVYSRTNVASNNYAAGASDSGNRQLRIRPRVAAGTTGIIETNAVGGTFTLPASDSRGFTAGSRNGPDATSVVGYKNGVAMTRSADPSAFNNTLLGTQAVFIGGNNSGGSLNLPSAVTIGLLVLGASLTPDQELAQYNNVQAFMTAVGANV